MNELKIKCTYTKLVYLVELVPNPRNTNKHTDQQIELLSKLMNFQGVRHPIIVSNLTGFIVAGHARLEAAKKNNYRKFPVDFQDFENEAQEYAFLESDNRIAELALHDKDLMFENLKEIDFDLLGIPDLNFPDVNVDEGEIKEKDVDENIGTAHECPSCGYKY